MTNPTGVEHVVVLMLENRSFDHLLGRLPGVNGILDKTGNVKPNLFNLAKPGDSSSTKFPAGMPADFAVAQEDISKEGFGGPGHSFPDATVQLQSSAATASAVSSPAPLDGFIANYLRELQFSAHRSHPSDDEIQEPMTTFTPAQLPVISQLAQQFCVCDQWFSEVPGPTQPNRLFAHAGTSVGLAHNVWSFPVQAQTIYEELDKAGRDWAFFYFDLSDSTCFPAIKSRTDRILKFDSFYEKAQTGALPSYSFLCPQYVDGKDGSKPSSEHAPFDIRYGELLLADVYEALRNGPAWNKTLLIITYDEHGGYFDHVSPPSSGVANPDGLTSPTAFDKEEAQKSPGRNGFLLKPNMQFDFTRLGLRVPAVIVSPFIQKGTVISTQFQHTSIFATLRELFGVGTLTKRDAQATSFASLLKLSRARTDAPVKLTRPAIPADSNEDTSKKPLTDRQKDLWPMLSQLDGHPHSGKVTKPPATRGAAADYIQERIAAHEQFHRERRRKAAYHVVAAGHGAYRWALHDEHGNVVATSPQAVKTPQEAETQIKKLRDIAPYAKQVAAAAAPPPVAAKKKRAAAGGR